MKRMLRFMALAGLCGAFCTGYAQTKTSKITDLGTLERVLHSEYHLHGHHVPMMFMVSGFTRAFTKGGVRGMRVVTYDSLPPELDREEVGNLMRTQLNDSWSLMVREQSTAKNGEEEMVWVQPFSDRVRLLVLDLEANEMNLVQMELSPEALKKWEDEHGG
jgi:hypothetical protein